MKIRNPIENLSFTAKILMLVGLMGLLAAAVTAYTLANMRSINRQYGELLAHEAQGALTVAQAVQHLGSATRLAYTVLTEQDESRMRDQMMNLATIKGAYDAELHKFKEFLPGMTAEVGVMATQSQSVFEMASRIMESAARWRGDKALQIIHSEFEPAVAALRRDMDALRDKSIKQFQTASFDLNVQTQKTIAITAFSIVGALLLVVFLTIHVAITHMSRPLAQLTRSMERMTERHYGDAIALTHRRDEIGKMASALRVFQQSMEREDRLAIEVAASAEALRLSQQLMDLISAIPGAVFQMQMTHEGWRRINFVSEKAAHLHGQTNDALQQIEGPPGAEFLYASAHAIQSAHDAFRHSACTLEPLDFDIAMTQDGTTRWLKTLATARRTENGGTVFNGVWLDVSEQTRQAASLAQAKDVAEKAAIDKARFLATMSHEIRTPLNAILGLVQLAVRHEKSDAQHERMQKALRAGRHLLNIVNDILDLSKIEAGKMDIERQNFAVHKWVQEICELAAQEVGSKGLEMTWRIAPDVPASVAGSRHRMSQILLNYLNNAIKFTPAGTIAIHIDMQEADAHGVLLRCAVQDSGIGISQQDQSLLFAAFSQADTSITRRFGGTGLGLAISRQLSELMGGSAGVISEPGRGSEFWFTARVLHVQASAPAPVGASQHGRGGAGQITVFQPSRPLRDVRVLLVDDNEINRAVAHGMLQMGGVLVDEACDGEQALAALRGNPDDTYALVLMDMQMPVMDGMTATRTLRTDARFLQLPVIALTANASAEDIARTRAAGMDDHLAKPLLEEDLWRCLNQWTSAHEHAVEPTSDAAGVFDATAAAVTNAPVAQVDRGALDDLRATLGTEHAQRLVVSFLHETAARLVRMKALADRPTVANQDSLCKEAHDLSGNAGCFGLTRVGEASAGLHATVSAQDEAGLRHAMAQLMEYAQSDLGYLRQWVSLETSAPVGETA